MQYQQSKKSLIESAKSNKDYSIKHFHRADEKYSLIYRKQKIVNLRLLENQVEWYHNILCQSRETHKKLFIAQHFYWN